MAYERQLNQLEKMIRKKMILIKNRKETPKESGIGKLINSLKTLDEPLFNDIMKEYKLILNNLK